MKDVDSAIVRPPHEVGALKAKTINQWRDWFKIADGGRGMYGPDRLRTIDRICDAAIIGMTGIMSSQADYRMTCAAWLRDAADQIESAV